MSIPNPDAASNDKVSHNAKQIFIFGLGSVTAIVVVYLIVPNELTEKVVLSAVSGFVGLLAGIADKLWGK